MATIGVKIELEGAPQYKENMSNLTAQTKLYQAQLKSLTAQMGSSASAFTKSMTESKALSQQLEAQKNQSKLLEEQIAKTTEKYGEDSTQVIRLKTQYQNLQAQIAQTTQALQEHGGVFGAIGAQLQEVGGKIEAVGSKIASVGDTLTTRVTVPIIGVGTAAVKTAASFDKSMSQVAATMGYTVDELNDSTSEASKTMEQLGEFAKKMGESTAFSASEAADALNYMALAGYDAETSMKMLPTVLDLAAAGGIELAAASDMVTDAQSALGLSLDDTALMVDKMAAASSKSNTSVAQLGEAFLTIGGTAKNLAGGTTELATALGILADNGVKGSEGGTALRNIILSLSAPTDTAAQKIEELGLSVFDAEGNMRELDDIMSDLNSAMDGMTQEDKAQALNKIFNKVDLKSVNALLATSSQRWNELSDAIKNSEGAASNMANTQLNNLEGQITLLKSALEGAAISIGEKLMPYISQLVDRIQQAVDWFNSLSEEQLEMIMRIAGIVAAVGPLLAIGGRLITGIASVITACGTISTFIGTTLVPLITGTIIPAVGAVATAIGGVVAAIIPFLPIIAAVAAAVAAVVIVIKNWGAISEWLSEKILMLQQYVTEHFGIIGQVIAAILENIKTVIFAAVEVIRTVIQSFMDAVKAIMEGDWKKVGEIILNTWNKVRQIIDQAKAKIVDTIENMLKSILDKFTEMKDSALNWGRDMIQNFLDGIMQKWNALKETVRNVADTVASYLHFSIPEKGPLHTANTWMPDMMNLLAKGITDNKKLITDALESSFNLESTLSASVNQPMELNTGSADVLNLLNQIYTLLPALANSQIVLDSGALVGQTAPLMNDALGQIYVNEQRSV